jgi:hypothetical protein
VNPVVVAGHLDDTVEAAVRTYAHSLRDDCDVSADALDRSLLVDPEAAEGRGKDELL